LRARLWPALHDIATAIEHVGSTAVPGLAAKPIIDLDVVVPSAAVVATVIDRVAALGYRHEGTLGIAGREAFAAPPGPPEHHMYVCVLGSAALRNHLMVRDQLRRDTTAAAAYGDLKRQLAVRYREDPHAYNEGKSAFILELLALAGYNASP